MKKRLICILCLAVLALAGCDIAAPAPDAGVGMNNEAEQNIPTTLTDITLAYHVRAKQNPLIESDALNQKLNTVLFLPAVTFDDKMQPIYGAASDCSVSGQTVTVKVNGNRKFTDGTAVTGAAVAACFQTVLDTPTSPYFRQLENIESVSASGNTVMLKLKTPDPGALFCLDIPIVKESGDKFVGCGDYMLSRRNGMDALIPSPYALTKPLSECIYIKDPENAEDLAVMFNGGVLDVLSTDLLTGGAFAAARNYDSMSVPERNMLYLGIAPTGRLQEAKFRAAVSTLIPREDIVKSVLMEYGTATTQPFYPSWNVVPHSQTAYTNEQIQAAFSAAGAKITNGEIRAEDGSEITLHLLACADNKTAVAIAEKCKSVAAMHSIKIVVETCETAEFTRRLKGRDFDMFVASYAVNHDLDPTPLYGPESEYNYGGMHSEVLDALYEQYRSGAVSVADYCKSFAAEMPIIPIAYTKTAVMYTKGIHTDGGASMSRPYADLGKWEAR